jgi:hypothetical protein
MNLLGSSAAFFEETFEDPSIFKPYVEKYTVNLHMKPNIDHCLLLKDVVQNAWEAEAKKSLSKDEIIARFGVKSEVHRGLIRKYGPVEIFERLVNQFLSSSHQPLDTIEESFEVHDPQEVKEQMEPSKGDIQLFLPTTWCEKERIVRRGPLNTLYRNIDDALNVCFHKFAPLYNGQCTLIEYSISQENWKHLIDHLGDMCFEFLRNDLGTELWNRFLDYHQNYNFEEHLEHLYSDYYMLTSPTDDVHIISVNAGIHHFLVPRKVYNFHVK